MKYKDENKHIKPEAGGGNTKQPEDTGSKQPAQSGKEASGEKNETAPAGKQSFVNLPKGGGAIHGMGEKFQANPVTGTGSYSVPLTISAGRGEFTPQLALGYDSGSGNGSFGLGWNVGIPSVSRKTDKGLPQYLDLENHESDTFILSGAEDLVAILKEENGKWKHDTRTEGDYRVFPYQPRTEGLFAVIERWYHTTNKVSHWRSISKENITSVYGLTNQAVIANTNHPEQIFTWMIEKSWNAKGNLIEFEYKRENYTAETGSGIASEVYEHQRRETNECLTNLYLKQVRYGNAAMYSPVYPTVPTYQNDWHFRLVFDYGDHPTNNPQVTPTQEWACRQDSFSTYKAGFEIRTYRMCKRVLMFHQFTELGTTPVLVKSTDFTYEENEHLALLKTATHKGYLNGNSEELPTLSFIYSEAKLGTKIYEVSPDMLNNIPDGVDGRSSQWADLYSEGINGILKQDQNAWYFIPNKGDQRYYEEPISGTPTEPELVLGGMRCELLKPAAVNTKKSSFHLADVDSDGLPELVINAPGMNGFYTRDENEQWQPFANFAEMPNLNLSDPNIKIVDLSGDGLGDIIIGKGDYFEIYLSEGKKGYGNYRRLRCNTTEEKGPKAIFSDELKQIYLADMSGDGLSDIVSITNGTLCYWPNLGYGHFGERVMMANPPHFERPDQFNPSQIRLADVDGTGTTDLIYFGSTTTKYWKNQAGNSWSEAQEINNFPQVDSMANAEVVDLFGNGTSCLIWSSKRPSQSRKMRYLELTSGIKPYLMIESDNGMGGITKLQYTTSTKYYLRDKLSGHPWITRLPFPVHVLEHVEIHDEVTGSVFTNRYAYHHGYYDHDEREFRGFGMVEQWDTEKYNVLMRQCADVLMGEIGVIEEIGEIGVIEEVVPPVYVKTWFHTGFFKNRTEISRQFAEEYFSGDSQAWLLPDTILPDGLTAVEAREACRALRGSALRKEVYAQDGTAQEPIPYTVEEKNFDICMLQGIKTNRHGVFHITERETLAYQYERDTADPRIMQSLVLETDRYGNVLKSAQVAYPRRVVPEDMPEQGKLHIIYTENKVINHTFTDINHTAEAGVHLIGAGYEAKAYEVTGILNYNLKFEKEALKTAVTDPNLITEIAYTTTPSTTIPQKRKIQHDRVYYWNPTLTDALPLGNIAPHALPYQKQSLEITQDILDVVNSQGTKITPVLLQNEGKYLQEGTNWWTISEIQTFDATAFYQPVSVTDPFGGTTQLSYDSHKLLVETVTDADNRTTEVENNYRLLQAWKMTDPNGNSQCVDFDTLGMVKAMAVMGKNGEGDTLTSPTIIYQYDLHNWKNNAKPVYSHVKTRETHADPDTRWMESYTYTSGLGQEVQTKVQAEDGLAWILPASGIPKQIETTDRWVATGRTILNNKGKAVKQYEPWFSTTPDYEPETELTEYGVTPILHYDPLTRNIKTDFPDGTFTKVEFTPWEQKSYDQNDNVLASQWYTLRSPSSTASTEDKRAAQITISHNNTPQTQYFDSMGRVFIIEDDNGTIDKYRVHNTLDIGGRPTLVIDAKGREMTHHFYAYKQPLSTQNIDSGKRWMLGDVAGKPIRAWNERGHSFRNTYDILQRPLEMFVAENNIEKMVQRQEYGSDASVNNVGQIEKIQDQSGETRIIEYDFKGNPLTSEKKYCEDYQNDIDWSQNPTLQEETFNQAIEYDALNRPTLLTQPDGSKIRYAYNKGAMLETVEVQHQGQGNYQSYVSNINYNEKGQRTDIYYGNNSKTKYEYDNKTFRVTRILTTRNTGVDILQNISYFYDPIGNITEMRDDAQQVHYFNNTVVAPTGKYEYDPLYRLLKAEGRELSSLNAPDSNDFANNIPVPNPSANAMQNYTQLFAYDQLGNIQTMSSQNQWTRTYNYNNTANNYLSSTQIGQDVFSYTYDVHGNMTSMPHLSSMQWDFADRLRQVQLNLSGDTAYYIYDSTGNRCRKVVEKGSVREERYYVDGYEVFRKFISGDLDFERQSLHISDDEKKFASIETKTWENGELIVNPVPAIRYQYDNHLGSACLELDETASIISYEEYHPFGTTSYRSGRTETEVSLKRYKYVGKERDEETGLYYYGARYYAAWLCRFVSVDPLQFDYPQLTPFNYAGNKPVTHIDIDGMQSTGDEKQGAQNQTKEQTGVNAYGTVGGLNVGIIDLSHGKSAGYYNLYPCYQKSDDGKYSFSFYMARHNNKDGTYDDVWVVGADAYKDFVKNPTKYQMLERSLKWAMQTGADPNKSQAENLWNAYKSIVFNPMSWVVGASMMVGVIESASSNLAKSTVAESETKPTAKRTTAYSEPKLKPKPEQTIHTLKPIEKQGSVFTQTAKEGDLLFYSLKIGDDIIEFGGDFSISNGTLTIKNFDIDGVLTNKLGFRGVKDIITEFGKQQGVNQVIIQGAKRTTGANPGKIPSKLIFKIN